MSPSSRAVTFQVNHKCWESITIWAIHAAKPIVMVCVVAVLVILLKLKRLRGCRRRKSLKRHRTVLNTLRSLIIGWQGEWKGVPDGIVYSRARCTVHWCFVIFTLPFFYVSTCYPRWKEFLRQVKHMIYFLRCDKRFNVNDKRICRKEASTVLRVLARTHSVNTQLSPIKSLQTHCNCYCEEEKW